MDPQRNTREDFTNAITSTPIPTNASEEWKTLVEKLQLRTQKVAQHPAMAPNLKQTYMTPANAKNKVYFMWDFVGRTLGMAYKVTPTSSGSPTSSPMPANQKNSWIEVMGRAHMSAQLILDTQPGMLDQMTESTYPGEMGKHPEFGEEILGIARGL